MMWLFDERFFEGLAVDTFLAVRAVDWLYFDLLGTEGKGKDLLLSSLLISLLRIVLRFFYNFNVFPSGFVPWFNNEDIGTVSFCLIFWLVLKLYFLLFIVDWFFFIIVVVYPLLWVGKDLSRSTG